jgi:hypothetical protein
VRGPQRYTRLRKVALAAAHQRRSSSQSATQANQTMSFTANVMPKDSAIARPRAIGRRTMAANGGTRMDIAVAPAAVHHAIRTKLRARPQLILTCD